MKVNSSNISTINYKPVSKVLEITFNNGKIYHYQNVSSSSYNALVKAKSHGEYLHEHIIPKHQVFKKG